MAQVQHKKQLEAQRGARKAALARLENWIESGTKVDVFDVEAHVNNLKRTISGYEKVQALIESIDPKDSDRNDFLARSTKAESNLPRIFSHSYRTFY